MLGLYIHIPFCVSKCAYCDFLSFPVKDVDIYQRYVEALIGELKAIHEEEGTLKLSTIYIGGGTPSVLSPDQLEMLMKTVYECFDCDGVTEVTMEVNPASGSKALFDRMKFLGINRVSMGVQSTDDTMLKILGRAHDYKGFLKTYADLKEAGIENFSLDAMFGLPGQSMEMFQKTLENLVDLKPKHLSVYSLIVEEGTPFYELWEEDALNLPDEDLERSMFWYAHDYLATKGYVQYEISNYAMEGYEAKHNKSYWELTPYIGVGLGAASLYEEKRTFNEKNLEDYMKYSMDLSKIKNLDEIVTPQRAMEEFFFLGLRKLKGVDLTKAGELFGDLLRHYDQVIVGMVDRGLLERSGNWLRLTPEGISLSNTVMSAFIL